MADLYEMIAAQKQKSGIQRGLENLLMGASAVVAEQDRQRKIERENLEDILGISKQYDIGPRVSDDFLGEVLPNEVVMNIRGLGRRILSPKAQELVIPQVTEGGELKTTRVTVPKGSKATGVVKPREKSSPTPKTPEQKREAGRRLLRELAKTKGKNIFGEGGALKSLKDVPKILKYQTQGWVPVINLTNGQKGEVRLQDIEEAVGGGGYVFDTDAMTSDGGK